MRNVLEESTQLFCQRPRFVAASLQQPLAHVLRGVMEHVIELGLLGQQQRLHFFIHRALCHTTSHIKMAVNNCSNWALKHSTKCTYSSTTLDSAANGVFFGCFKTFFIAKIVAKTKKQNKNRGEKKKQGQNHYYYFAQQKSFCKKKKKKDRKVQNTAEVGFSFALISNVSITTISYRFCGSGELDRWGLIHIFCLIFSKGLLKLASSIICWFCKKGWVQGTLQSMNVCPHPIHSLP